MTTEHKLWAFAIGATFTAILVVVSYNTFERLQAAELYRECLKTMESITDKKGDRLVGGCSMR